MLTAATNEVGCRNSILLAQKAPVLQPIVDQWAGVTRKCLTTASLTSVASQESACGPRGMSVHSVSRGCAMESGGITATNGLTWPDLIICMALLPRSRVLKIPAGVPGWPGSAMMTGNLVLFSPTASYCGGSHTSTCSVAPETLPCTVRMLIQIGRAHV